MSGRQGKQVQKHTTIPFGNATEYMSKFEMTRVGGGGEGGGGISLDLPETLLVPIILYMRASLVKFFDISLGQSRTFNP